MTSLFFPTKKDHLFAGVISSFVFNFSFTTSKEFSIFTNDNLHSLLFGEINATKAASLFLVLRYSATKFLCAVLARSKVDALLRLTSRISISCPSLSSKLPTILYLIKKSL